MEWKPVMLYCNQCDKVEDSLVATDGLCELIKLPDGWSIGAYKGEEEWVVCDSKECQEQWLEED